MSAKGIWIAFVVGVSAGACVALLYAPESGARTRKRIGRGIDDGVDYLQDAAEYLKQQAEDLAKQAGKSVKSARGQVNDAIDTVSEAVSGAAKAVQSVM